MTRLLEGGFSGGFLAIFRPALKAGLDRLRTRRDRLFRVLLANQPPHKRARVCLHPAECLSSTVSRQGKSFCRILRENVTAAQ